MKQRYAVIVLFALIIASSFTSLDSYRSTSRMVNEDMDRALALALEAQQSDVISQDTIRTFNSHLQIAELRGKATLAVDTHGQYLQSVRPKTSNHPLGDDGTLGNADMVSPSPDKCQRTVICSSCKWEYLWRTDILRKGSPFLCCRWLSGSTYSHAAPIDGDVLSFAFAFADENGDL